MDATSARCPCGIGRCASPRASSPATLAERAERHRSNGERTPARIRTRGTRDRVFSTPSPGFETCQAPVSMTPVDTHAGEHAGVQSVVASPSGLQGQLTVPAFERSQRVGEKAAPGSSRCPGSKQAGASTPVSSKPRAPSSARRASARPTSARVRAVRTRRARNTRGIGALESVDSPARGSPDESPGRSPRTKWPPAGRAEDPSLGCVREGMPASGWIRDQPGCRRVHRGAAPARCRRTATG